VNDTLPLGTAPVLPRPGISPRDFALIVILGVIWGSAFPVIRLGLLAGASPFLFASVRYLLAAAIMAGIAAGRSETCPPRRTLLLYAVLGGVFVIGGYAAFLYAGETRIGGGLATVFVASAPMWTAILGVSLLPSERLGRRGAAGVLLGFVGVAVLFLPDELGSGGGMWLGETLVLFAALSFSIGAVLLRRWSTGPAGGWGLTVEFAIAGGILGLLAVRPGTALALPLTGPVLGSLAFLVAGPSIVGYAIYFHLLHRVGPTRSSLVAYVNPLTGIVVGIFLLGESVGIFELLGFLIIVGGLFLLQYDRAPRRLPRPT
jgi:drug/metabolite transporter (DMT)-like permease